MSYAFIAANNLGGTFKLFFSFDYLGGSAGAWPKSDVLSILQSYGPNGAYFNYQNKPYVSTFEGTANINDWASIRASLADSTQTNPPFSIFFVPDWTSLGPSGFASHLSAVDGAFSWDMWPAGPTDSNDSSDLAWQSAIGSSKVYMMGVSPWFFTDLPGYNKEWVWRGDDMWHLRWQQTLTVKPQIVEIVTWNDYGESHYIGPIVSNGIPYNPSVPGVNAHTYVDGMPHDHWRDTLPYYIQQYKAAMGSGSAPSVSTETLSYWYRLAPKGSGSDNGVTGNDCAYQTCYTPEQIVQDEVFVTALIESLPAEVHIQIGNNAATTHTATTVGVNHFSQAFNGQTGDVTFSIVRNGQTVVSGKGNAITSSPSNGINNYNAWVGGTGALPTC
jgi:glucan endo-1,3-alpha-glucosidase